MRTFTLVYMSYRKHDQHPVLRYEKIEACYTGHATWRGEQRCADGEQLIATWNDGGQLYDQYQRTYQLHVAGMERENRAALDRAEEALEQDLEAHEEHYSSDNDTVISEQELDDLYMEHVRAPYDA